ncbi:hypothetical protein L484_007385 [Morus notabilis]|uniref:Uncharacterized protein n=1 Tax=Morus notabilis TaxID=981085 RepID=W9S9C5_9ROSA|nr:hypothetical protein L484_007385 [Morus notabilis]
MSLWISEKGWTVYMVLDEMALGSKTREAFPRSEHILRLKEHFGSIELMSHERTMEFSTCYVLYVGSVVAGALISPMMYPNFPLPQMTILMDQAPCKFTEVAKLIVLAEDRFGFNRIPVQFRIDFEDRENGEGTRIVLDPSRNRDGWKEIEMGEFFNEHGDDGSVDDYNSKSGLIVEGIEFRPKASTQEINRTSGVNVDAAIKPHLVFIGVGMCIRDDIWECAGG